MYDPVILAELYLLSIAIFIGAFSRRPRSRLISFTFSRFFAKSANVMVAVVEPAWFAAFCMPLRHGDSIFMLVKMTRLLAMPVVDSCSPTCRSTLGAAGLRPRFPVSTSRYSLYVFDVNPHLTHRNQHCQHSPTFISLATVNLGIEH